MLRTKCRMHGLFEGKATPCNPNTEVTDTSGKPKPGHHWHKCDECGYVWEHADEMSGNDEAHQCVCGEYQFYKYFGAICDSVSECCRRTRKAMDAIFALLFG